MGVALREKKNKGGTVSLYLDIYHKGERHYEFLQNLSIVTKPTTALQRENNREARALARKILAKKQHELESSEYDITPAFKQRTDFVAFFSDYVSKYSKKDKRVMVACLGAFKDYLKDKQKSSLQANKLTADIIEGFRDYLLERYNYSTPHNYFKKLKKVVKVAVRKRLLHSDPSMDINLGVAKGISKNVLSYKEYELLAKTEITNVHIKRAFFFSLYTGLRFSDIVALKWQNIDLVNGSLRVRQAKTGAEVNMLLNPVALNVIGKKGKSNDLVFKLPSHTACTKSLRVWIKKAGIDKHITWHCARHSFATNHIIGKVDVKTISELLGHTSTAYTERYTHLVKEIKNNAILNMPKVEI